MNRSFRGSETLMPSIRSRVSPLPSVQSSVRDKEDDLALFLEMRKRDKDKSDLNLIQHSDDLNDESSELKAGANSPRFNGDYRKKGGDDILNFDGEKNDYDWLLTPPGTPLFPSLETESRKTYMNETEAPKAQSTVLRSRLANTNENIAKSTLVPRQSTGSSGLASSASGMRRPSSSGGPGSRPVTPASSASRPATPTARPTLTSKSSRPSTPNSRAPLSSSKPKVHSSSPKPSVSSTLTRPTTSMAPAKSMVPSRSSTPSRSTTRPLAARPSAPSNGPSRSSTPTRTTARPSTPTTTRSTARSSTPTTRPTTVPASRPTSRASTPTRRPSTPSSVPGATSSFLNKSSSSISSKSGPSPSKNPAHSRGTSPTVRSRPWNPSEMPGFSLDAPPNLRTTLPDRPLSATRGRPSAPSARSTSVEPVSNGKQRRQSRSPSRGRAPNGGVHSSGSSVPAVNRGHSKVGDEVSPVVMGTKMVERVVNMRKLAPPRHNDKHALGLSGKSASSPDSSGLGRTLSKKSLDMAIRHMDIRRTIPGNLRPLMTKIPASSMYSVRSGPTGSRTASVSDSPLATSSNASSELSVNNHALAMDVHGSEFEYDLVSERGGQTSPTNVHVG